MKIAVIQFPGSNCDRETKLAVERVGMQAHDFLWNEAKEKLQEFAGYIIVGGFSYEDRGRAGLIASLDPVLTMLADEASKGKPLLGICNGAQILVEAGLVPNLTKREKLIALTTNKRVANNEILGTGFYNAWVQIKPKTINPNNAFTNAFKVDQVIRIPAAHAEGRFVLAESLYEKLTTSNSALFEYCDADGKVVNQFPVNPNGSMHNLAAVGNASGNIMAMMPHPERTTIGDPVFRSMKNYIANNQFQLADFDTPNVSLESKPLQPTKNLELIVSLNIHDNEAISINQALRQTGFEVELKRFTHWEVINNATDQEKLQQKLKTSYELYNPQKESLIDKQTLTSNSSKLLLVREKDDLVGQYKQRLLNKHFSLAEVQQLKHGTLWQITAKENLDEIINTLIAKGIFANPIVHECYHYDVI